jgi:hypothetical protein
MLTAEANFLNRYEPNLDAPPQALEQSLSPPSPLDALEDFTRAPWRVAAASGAGG